MKIYSNKNFVSTNVKNHEEFEDLALKVGSQILLLKG